MPLILLKKALNQNPTPGTWSVYTDDVTACGNLTQYIHQIAKDLATIEHEGYTELRFSWLGEQSVSQPLQESHSEDYIVVLSSDTMGSGDDELGKLLMRAFVNALEAQEVKPSRIICYNRGALLALEGTDTGDSLKKLHQEFGIAITVCGTCADYFEVKERLAVGTISNLFTITEYLRSANRVVQP